MEVCEKVEVDNNINVIPVSFSLSSRPVFLINRPN